MEKIIGVESCINRGADPESFEGHVIYSLNGSKVKINFLCNYCQARKGIFDFIFIEDGKEYALKGKMEDGILRKISDRQNVLYFATINVISQVSKILKSLPLETTSFTGERYFLMSELHIDLIFKNNLN